MERGASSSATAAQGHCASLVPAEPRWPRHRLSTVLVDTVLSSAALVNHHHHHEHDHQSLNLLSSLSSFSPTLTLCLILFISFSFYAIFEHSAAANQCQIFALHIAVHNIYLLLPPLHFLRCLARKAATSTLPHTHKSQQISAAFLFSIYPSSARLFVCGVCVCVYASVFICAPRNRRKMWTTTVRCCWFLQLLSLSYSLIIASSLSKDEGGGSSRGAGDDSPGGRGVYVLPPPPLSPTTTASDQKTTEELLKSQLRYAFSLKSHRLLRRAATARLERLWDFGVIPYDIESNFSGTFERLLANHGKAVVVRQSAGSAQ